MREFFPHDDLCELGQEGVKARWRARSSRRRGGPCQSKPDKTVLVSATIRITGAAFGARGVDLCFDFFRSEGR